MLVLVYYTHLVILVFQAISLVRCLGLWRYIQRGEHIKPEQNRWRKFSVLPLVLE